MQHCFEHADWGVFKDSSDLDAYTSSVLDHGQFCTDAVLLKDTVKVFPYKKSLASHGMLLTDMTG